SVRSEEAFAAIVARHGKMVYRACARLLANAQDAEDASQVTFLHLAQQPPTVVNGSLAGWLHTVARHASLKLLRVRASSSRHVRLVSGNVECDPVVADHLREELDAALEQIPGPLQEAIILRYLEGRSLKEAALLAGCPLGTLGRRALEGLQF